MKSKKLGNRFARFFRFVYLKLFRINDTPQKIALGLGLGVFLGILPGTGPIAALVVAFILRLNRAAALLGSLLTNTWISIVTFVFAVQLGSSLLGLQWQTVYKSWEKLLRNFHWKDLMQLSFADLVLPVVIGYIIVSLAISLTFYVITITMLRLRKKRSKGGIQMAGVKEVGEKYRCSVCGNEVVVTKVGGGELVCCGKPMEKLKDK